MLSRAADALFWLARYMERMDNLARLIEAAQSMAGVSSEAEEWRSALTAAGVEELYDAAHPVVTPELAARFLCSAPSNPSSIMNCLELARINARAMRTALTRDMWEAVNQGWLESRTLDERNFSPALLSETLDWVRTLSTRFSGAYETTMLRNENYWFVRLGTFVERADNTARILDVKYHVLRPQGDEGATDFYQWGALLRSVSAFEVYRKVYRDVITPERVTELLILRDDMPRSLHFCMNGVVKTLDLIANSHSGETQRQVGLLHAQLHYGRVEDILAHGLHEWLSDFMDRIYMLGGGISKDFLVPMSEAA